jgi:hypothetical protein
MEANTLLIGAAIVIGMSVLILVVMMMIRDIVTHNQLTIKAVDHIWVNFAPRQGKGWNALVKLDDQKTGAFTYKGRQYFAGEETWDEFYPPGRGALAQVSFHKCLADPASSDMLTNITGKPTVDAILVYSVLEQKDTAEAMQRSREESGMGKGDQKTNWLLIGIALSVIVGIVGIVFTIKGQSGIEHLLTQMSTILSKLSGVLGVK